MMQKKSFMRTGFNFLLVLLLLALFHCGQSEQLKPDQDEGNRDQISKSSLEKLSLILENKMKEYQIPGLSIAVVKGDDVLMCKGLGWTASLQPILPSIDRDCPRPTAKRVGDLVALHSESARRKLCERSINLPGVNYPSWVWVGSSPQRMPAKNSRLGRHWSRFIRASFIEDRAWCARSWKRCKVINAGSLPLIV